jgi:hypothetical protein
MNPMRRLLIQIYQLPIIGDLLCYAVFVLFFLIIGPVVWLSGGQRLRFGTSVIWIPKKEAQIIIEGVELLRSRDPEMFIRLTTKQRLIIYYTQDASVIKKASSRVFALHSKFVELGPECVACIIAQSLMLAAAAPHINQCRLNDQERAALKSVSRNMVEWLSKHSFHPGLISPYQKIVERQEQGVSSVK